MGGRWGWKSEGLIRGWATRWRGQPLIWGHCSAYRPVSVQHFHSTSGRRRSSSSASQIQSLARTNTRSLFSLTRNYVNGMQRALGQSWPIARYRRGPVDKEMQSGSPLTPGSLCKQCGRDARDSPNHSLNRARCCCHRQTVTNTRLDTAAV